MKGHVFQVNDLVFAKVRGYPSWPARVSDVTETSKYKKYSVFFYGTYETAVCKQEELLPYNETTFESMSKLNMKKKQYAKALDEMRNTPHIKPPVATSAASSTAVTSSPKSVGTPKSQQQRKRKDSQTPSGSSAKRGKTSAGGSAVSTPTAGELEDATGQLPAQQLLSRSGRKIKVKKFDDDGVEAAASSPSSAVITSPATARTTKQPSQASSLADVDADRESVGNEHDDELNEPEHASAGDLPAETAATSTDYEQKESEAAGEDDASRERQEQHRRTVRLVDESAEFVNDENSAGDDKQARPVMRVRAKCGVLLEVDLSDPKRPTSFKSERARIMWDSATAINKRRLITDLQNGNSLPSYLFGEILARPDLSRTARRRVKYMRQQERCQSRKMWFRMEVRLLDLDYRIKSNLLIDHQNNDGCLNALQDLSYVRLAPLMLKKYPEIVDTVRKCRRYKYCEKIRHQADQCYLKLKSLFVVPPNKTFRLYFDELVAQFRLYTESLSKKEVALLCVDPLFMKPDEKDSSSDEDDEDDEDDDVDAQDGQLTEENVQLTAADTDHNNTSVNAADHPATDKSPHGIEAALEEVVEDLIPENIDALSDPVDNMDFEAAVVEADKTSDEQEAGEGDQEDSADVNDEEEGSEIEEKFTVDDDEVVDHTAETQQNHSDQDMDQDTCVATDDVAIDGDVEETSLEEQHVNESVSDQEADDGISADAKEDSPVNVDPADIAES